MNYFDFFFVIFSHIECRYTYNVLDTLTTRNQGLYMSGELTTLHLQCIRIYYIILETLFKCIFQSY